MSEARSIMKLTPAEGDRLAAESGRSSAGARVYVLWCAWQRILHSGTGTRAQRAKAFSRLCAITDIKVEA